MEALTALTTAVNDLAAIEPIGLSNESLERLIVQIRHEATRLLAVEAKVTSTFDLRAGWRHDGSRSMAAWLARRCHTSARASRAQVRRAKRLRGMPATAAALAAGEIDDAHVAILSMLAGSPRKVIRDAFSDAEETLVEFAKDLEFEDFVAACRHWEDTVDPDGTEQQAADDVAARRLHASEIIRGNVVIDGLLDPVRGAVFALGLKRIERELFDADWAEAKLIHGEHTRIDHLERTPAQRRADALVEMAKRAQTAPADGKQPRPLFVAHVGYENSARRMCELNNGTVVAPGQLLPYLADADLERLVWGPGDRTVTLSKTARFFTGPVRRAMEHRDRQCQHPGCTEEAEFCEGDHIRPRSHGGETTLENGQMMCGRHNRHAYTTYKPPPDDEDDP
jgi:hypothetical protein